MNKKSLPTCVKWLFLDSDPAEARTQDPQIKSLLLYQLSYEVIRQIKCKIHQRESQV